MAPGRKRNPSPLPDPLEKREILFSGETDPAILVELGARFLSEGYPFDALNCFVQADSRAHLEEMLAEARRTGDTFLVEHAARALGVTLDSRAWSEIAARAEELGKSAFAQVARLRARGDASEEPEPPEEPAG